jgi:hypothetical protein
MIFLLLVGIGISGLMVALCDSAHRFMRRHCGFGVSYVVDRQCARLASNLVSIVFFFTFGVIVAGIWSFGA